MEPNKPSTLESLKHYCQAAEDLREFSKETRNRFEAARRAGDLEAAREALSSLEARTEELKKLRMTLSPQEIFIAKYSVEVHGPHEVSFTIPRGVSRMEMLREAHAIFERESNLVSAAGFMFWEKSPAFTAEVPTPERFRIQGNVIGGEALTRGEQERFLKERELSMPRSEDLASAFVAHYVATKEPLFKWFNPRRTSCSYVIRASSGALFFMRGVGLGNILVDDELRATRFTGIGVSVQVDPVPSSSEKPVKT